MWLPKNFFFEYRWIFIKHLPTCFQVDLLSNKIPIEQLINKYFQKKNCKASAVIINISLSHYHKLPMLEQHFNKAITHWTGFFPSHYVWRESSYSTTTIFRYFDERQNSWGISKEQRLSSSAWKMNMRNFRYKSALT